MSDEGVQIVVNNCAACEAKHRERPLDKIMKLQTLLPVDAYEGDPRKGRIFVLGVCYLCEAWGLEYEYSKENQWLALQEAEEHVKKCFHDNVFTKVPLECACEPSEESVLIDP